MMGGIVYSSWNHLLIDAVIVPGTEYKLQLLFSENYGKTAGTRTFDITVENQLLYEDFDIIAESQEWTTTPTVGVVVSHTFTATDDTLNIDLNTTSIGALAGGFTLEVIPEPATLGLVGLASGLLFVLRRIRMC